MSGSKCEHETIVRFAAAWDEWVWHCACGATGDYVPSREGAETDAQRHREDGDDA